MSNVTDFEALNIRIAAATDRLEMDVLELDALIANAEGAVSVELGKLRDEAQAAATAAKASAANAKVSETNALRAAVEAAESASKAKATADTLLASAPFQEAPMNGAVYGRSNGRWTPVEGGGTGGGGKVETVNGKAPDAAGNVVIAIPTKVTDLTDGALYAKKSEVPAAVTKTSQLQNDSGFITLTQVPAAPVQEAPDDGKQYARKNKAWSEVVASGEVSTINKPTYQYLYSGATFLITKFSREFSNRVRDLNSSGNFTKGSGPFVIDSWTLIPGIDGNVSNDPFRATDIRSLNITYEGTPRFTNNAVLDEPTGNYSMSTINNGYIVDLLNNVPSIGQPTGQSWAAFKIGLPTGKWDIGTIPALPSGSHNLPDSTRGKKGIIVVEDGKPFTLLAVGRTQSDSNATVDTYTFDFTLKRWNAAPTAATRTSQLTNDSGFITAAAVPTKTSQLANDSGFIKLTDVPASVGEAPRDGKQYARQDASWTPVAAGGGESQVPFLFRSLVKQGLASTAGRVCFNYALFNAIQEKGTFFWNDPDTINAVNSDENWLTPATYNPVGATNQAIDIRCFRVYSLDSATGAVKGHSGAIWDGSKWLPGNAFLGMVGQITGEYSDIVVSPSVIRSCLPAGKWLYPAEVQAGTNLMGLPTAQVKVNHALVTKTAIDLGGTANFPFGGKDAFDLFWVTNTNVASKGQYYLQPSNGLWVNVGLGTQ